MPEPGWWEITVIAILLLVIAAGSKFPAMVRQVLAWARLWPAKKHRVP